MVPWRVATGITAALAGLAAILLPQRVAYLRPWWEVVLADHGEALAWMTATALATVFAATYWAARKAGLGDLGRKVEHLDRGLRGGEAAHDRDLAEALRRDRAADWGPGGSASGR